MNGKKVNVKVVEKVTDAELERLTKGLKSIKGFDFLIDSETSVRSQGS